MRPCDPSLFGLGADPRFLMGMRGLGEAQEYDANTQLEFEAADSVRAEVMATITEDKVLSKMAKSLKTQMMKEAATKAAVTTAIGCMGPVGAVIAVLLSVAQMFAQKKVEKKQKAIMKGFSERMAKFAADEVNRILLPAIEPTLDQELRNAFLLMEKGTNGLHGIGKSFKRIGQAMSKAPKNIGKGVAKAGKNVGDWATGMKSIEQMKRKVAAAEAELKPKITKTVEDKAAYFQTPEGKYELRQIAKDVLSRNPAMRTQAKAKVAGPSTSTKTPLVLAGAAAAVLLAIGLTR